MAVLLLGALFATVSPVAAQVGGGGMPFNEAPVAAFSYTPDSPMTGQSVVFDASESYDPDGTIVRYEWDFTGDGHFDASGLSAAWTFPEPGTYLVTLFVVDNMNAASRVTREVRVGTLSAGPFEAQFSYAPEHPRPNQVVTFNATASTLGTPASPPGASSSPPGTSTPPPGTAASSLGDGVVTYEWDLDGDGIFESRGPIVSRRYDRDGVYAVTLRITDNMGRMAQTTRMVQVGRGLVRVSLASEPSDVQVFIDGLDHGRTPVVLELEPKRHTVRLKHLWRGEWETELDLRFVTEVDLRIVLR